MSREEKTSLRFIAAGIVLATGIFLIDLSFPLGVAGGVPYVALVLLSLWSPNRRFTWGAATVASALTVLGFLLSAPGGAVWMVLVNRSLALLVIWVTAVLCLARARAEGKLRLQGLIVERMVEGVILVRPTDGVILFCNPPFERMFGYGPGELVGQPVAVVNAAGQTSPQETADTIMHCLNETGSWAGDVHNVKKDGTRFWCHSVVSSLDHPEFGRVWFALHEDVDERKRAEEALRVASERNERILAGAMDGFVTLDLDGRFCDANEAYCAIVGYSRADLLGMSIQDVEAQETAEETAQHVQLLLKEGNDRFESKQRCRDGRLIDVEVSANLIDVGGTVQICSFIRDVTERKLAEKALRDSEIRFRTTFESAAIPMVLSDVNGMLVETNPAFQKLFGYSAEELAGLKFTQITHSEDRDKGWDLFKQLVAGKISKIQLEKRYVRKDGSLILANTTASAIRDTQGRFLYSVGMVQDITAHRQAEEALRESEERFRSIYEQGQLGVAVVDSDYRLLNVNPKFCELLGYTEEELTALRFTDITHAEDLDTDVELAKQLFQGEIPSYQIEKRYLRKDGQTITVNLTASVLRGKEGEPVFGLGMIEDITARKQAEEARRASESRFRGLLEAEPDGVVVVDGAGCINLVNTKVAKMFGYRREELLGEPIELLVPQRLREKHVGHRAAFLNQPQARPMGTELEVIGRRKDGSEFPADVNLSPLRTDEGLFVMSIVRDITERKRAEQALRFTQFAVDHNSDATYWVRSDGRISYVNHAACQALGYSYQELMSMRVPEIDPEFPDEIWEAHFLEIKEAGSMTFEAQHRTKSGRLFPVEILANYLAYDDQEYLCAYVRDITERKRAEEILRESEERFRVVFESAPFGMVVVDAAGIPLRYNRAFQEMLGYSEQELREKDVAEYTHPDDLEDTRRLFAELRQGKRDLYQLDKRYVRKDGQIVWGSLAFTSVRDAQGDVQYLIATVKDITERKRAEEALRESELKYRELFESAYDVICLVDGEGNIVDINRRGELVTGYSRAELCGMNLLRQLVVPEDRDIPRWLLERAAPGAEHMYEMRWRTKDGRTIHLEGASTFRFSHTGEFLSTRCTLRDITERKRVEAERERLMSAIEQARETIIITDADAVIKYVNPAFERTTGYSRAEAVGQTPSIVKSGRHDDGFYKEMWDTLTRGETWTGEIINKKKEGTLYTEDTTISPVFDAAGKTVNYVAVKHDITERKRAEEHTRQLQADLAHMSRLSSMGEMATGLAHELNQPLTVITNYAQGCVRRLKTNAISEEELESILGRIATQARRSSSIIRGLENLVRKSSARQTDIDVNQSIMEVAELANAEAAQHHAKARFELEPNLPSVKADQTQLQQVILNLVQNGCEAIEDMPTRRREVTVRTKQRKDSQLEIAVSDCGAGIPEELSERLFEPFVTTKAHGIGMGLAISRSIVESHGGRLWATPNRSGGTTFHFTLPIAGGGDGDEE